jgi:DNA-binding CsgD family transcriptional regulator
VDSDQPLSLTRREVEILCLVARGVSSKEIANQLSLSLHTVSNHRKHICHKLGCHTPAQLILYVIEHSLLSFDD